MDSKAHLNPIAPAVFDQNSIEGFIKIGQVIAIFLSNKIFSIFLKKFKKKIVKLYMTIIFKILRSSFLQTPPVLKKNWIPQ